MKLGTLLPGGSLPPGAADLEVSGITSDSRKATPGCLFFAVPGHKADGAAFVPQAIERGAIAIVSPHATDRPGVACCVVPNVRAALSAAAALFSPGQPGTIVAVTGTSGKTSVTAFVRQIWTALGHRAASLGTIGLVGPSGSDYGSLTTPDPVSLHATLDRLARACVTHLAVEASSHGLDQFRLDGLRLTAGAFTNLSHDHLDYHASLDDYLAAKLRLFEALLQPRQTAVIDADSAMAATVERAAQTRGLDILTTGQAGRSLRLVSAEPDGFVTRMVVAHDGRRFDVRLPLAGRFQVSNALVAAGLCIATGGDPGAVLVALETLEGAPGRLDRAGTRNGAPVFVDYAHKPDALETVLRTLRPYARHRLIAVFGCGGDRDAAKRPLMGAIAARGADVTIVTDDNPRTEDPAAIRAAILAAAPGAIEIADRGAAIEAAVAMLGDGDVLVVAGKGHESGQIVGATVLPFSDHDTVRAAIAKAGS